MRRVRKKIVPGAAAAVAAAEADTAEALDAAAAVAVPAAVDATASRAVPRLMYPVLAPPGWTPGSFAGYTFRESGLIPANTGGRLQTRTKPRANRGFVSSEARAVFCPGNSRNNSRCVILSDPGFAQSL
jgi:hypothetical protein